LEETRDILFTLKTSLSSFSVRLLKCNACGDRARSTPNTSLEPARPRGKQRQSFGLLQDSHQSELVIEKRGQQSLGTEGLFNLTKNFSLRPGLYILFGGSFHDLIWISKIVSMTLFGLARFFSMIWSCFFP